MKLDEVIKNILSGDAVLFLGAGFSYDSKNIKGQKMGDANGLINLLKEEMNAEDEIFRDLGQATQCYLDAFECNKSIDDKKEWLVELLQEKYRVFSYADEQKVIASLEWMRIYTTNYDNTIEYIRGDKNTSSFTLENSPDSITRIANCIIHLNGYVNEMNPDKFEDYFKLSTHSYVADSFNRSRVKRIFTQDLDNAKVIVFIGVSLEYDNDIKRILLEGATYKSKIIFIDKEITGKLSLIEKNSRMNREKYGTVFEIGLKGLANQISVIKENFVKNDIPFEYSNFESLNVKKFKVIEEVCIDDLVQLLIYGKIDDNLVYSNVETQNYIIDRDKMQLLIDNIKLNDMTNTFHIINSDLGNGKTVFLKKLSFKLLNQGYKVFVLQNTHGKRYKNELLELCKLDGKKVLIIDDFSRYYEVLDFVSDMYSHDIILILSIRTHFINAQIKEIESRFGSFKINFEYYDLDELSSSDVDLLYDLFTKSNLYVDVKEKQRNLIKLIRGRYKNRISETILGILESQTIGDRIKKIVSNSITNKHQKEMLLALVINSSIDLKLSINDINDYLNYMGDFSSPLNFNGELSELIEKRSCIIKSSVFAKYLLHSVFEIDFIIEVCKKLIVAEEYFHSYTSYAEEDGNRVLRNLASQSNMNILTNYKANFEKIKKYYDSIASVSFYKNNPFFFLQYGMAALTAKNYEVAKIMLDNSRRLYQGIPNYDSFQLDTQYARYLLQFNLENGTENPIEIIFEAHEHLKNALKYRLGDRNKVLSQALMFMKFFNSYRSRFANKELVNLRENIFEFYSVHMQQSLKSTLGMKHNTVKEYRYFIEFSQNGLNFYSNN